MRALLLLQAISIGCGARTELKRPDAAVDAVTPSTCERIRPVDVLVVVDASGSMVDEIRELRDQVGTLLRGLARPPDRDGDGIADWAGVGDLHFAVTSTALEGAFETMGRGEECLATYPRFHAYRAGDDVEGFVEGAACVAAPDARSRAGEALFSAALRALLPVGGEYPIDRPLGDTAHLGFLRPGSLIVIVFMTDEDDRSRCRLGDGLEGRCETSDERRQEHIDAFRRLHPSGDLMMAVIAGLPEGVREPEEVRRVTEETRGFICSRFLNTAIPAPHLVGVAMEFSPLFESICSPSFSNVAERLARRVGEEHCR